MVVAVGHRVVKPGGVRTAAQDGAMTMSVETTGGDLRARLVTAFLSGIRSAAAQHTHFHWTRGYAGRALALCDRTEQLGMPAAYLVVELCCAGRRPLRFEDALATVEAVLRSAETV